MADSQPSRTFLRCAQCGKIQPQLAPEIVSNIDAGLSVHRHCIYCGVVLDTSSIPTPTPMALAEPSFGSSSATVVPPVAVAGPHLRPGSGLRSTLVPDGDAPEKNAEKPAAQQNEALKRSGSGWQSAAPEAAPGSVPSEMLRPPLALPAQEEPFSSPVVRQDPSGILGASTPSHFLEQAVSTQPDPELLGGDASGAERLRRPGSNPRRRLAAGRSFAPAKSAGGQRAALLIVAGGTALAIVLIVVVFLSQRRAEKNAEKALNDALTTVQKIYASGEYQKTLEKISGVRKLFKDKAIEFSWDERKIREWNSKCEIIKAGAEKYREVEEIFSISSENPTQACERLNNFLSLLKRETPENSVPYKHAQARLAEAKSLERKAFLAEMAVLLAEQEKQYLDGNISPAASAANVILEKYKSRNEPMEEKTRARVEKLRLAGVELDKAHVTRNDAVKDFVGAKKKIETQIKNAEERFSPCDPLVRELKAARKQVADAEKQHRLKRDVSSAQLSSKQRELLINAANAVASEGLFCDGKITDNMLTVKIGEKELRMGLHQLGKEEKDVTPFVFYGGARLLIDLPAMKSPAPLAIIKNAFETLQSMQEAGVDDMEVWDARGESPFLAARRQDGDDTLYFFNGTIYRGKETPPTRSALEVERNLRQAVDALKTAVEKDAPTPEEVRKVVAKAVEAAGKKMDWHEHLPQDYVSRVLSEDYIERNMPGAGDRLQKQLQEFKEAYRAWAKLVPAFQASGGGGEALEIRRSHDGRAVWMAYRPKENVTTYAIRHDDDDMTSGFFVVYDFPGKVESWPVEPQPSRVRMAHKQVGVVSSYDPRVGTMEYDETKWRLAANMQTPWPRERPPLYGRWEWTFPPHVLLINEDDYVLGLVTPAGRLNMPSFEKVTADDAKTRAKEQFLDDCAKVLNSTGALHLFFRHFFEYIFDSPVTSLPNLLGSRAHCGDIHQTVGETLERKLGGRIIGDCDDLAEFYMAVTRRQGKASFVLGLPGHAACGWAEKDGGGWSFQFLDTGYPRIFYDRDLDKVIEIAERSYDQTGTMRFDPKSIIFLFRFAGEPTRTPYLLSSRMFTDSEYAETMERVQSYWHFHFYALGVKTMEERLKFDAVPENYTELAGLYGRVHEVDKAVNCTQEALRRLKTDELLTRFNEEHRIGLMYKESGRNEEAMAAVQGMLKDLMGMYPTQAEAQTMPRQALEERAQKAMRFISSRMTLASLLTQLEQPWLAWKLIRIDVRLITQRPKFEQFSMPTAVFEKMKELEREGRSLSEEERLLGAELEKMLSDYYGKWAYDKDDSYNDILRKYAFTGMFYGAKYGKSRLLEELLKDGPYPIVKEKDQRRRSGNETDDWTWIRLAPYSYQFLIRKLLDPEPDKIPSAADLSEMIKLSEALERAADRARKYGSLSHLDHEIITVRLARCFVKKEWPGLEAVLNEVKKENWARLTTQAAETFGESARFVTPDEFAVQYKLFSRYIKDRTAYFSVVYAAYRAGAYEHAIRAAKIAMECWPNDEEMKREEKFLEELVRNRLEEKKAKPKAPVQNSTLPNLTPRRTSRFDFLLSPNCWVPAIP